MSSTVRGAAAQAVVLQQIQGIARSILSSLSNHERQLDIHLSRESRYSGDHPGRALHFPARDANGAWRFAVTLRLLELIHEAISNNVTISKRNIYYRDPALFGSQDTVDRYIDDITSTLGVHRSELGVTAVPKGLIAGCIDIHTQDGSTLNVSMSAETLLIPNSYDIVSLDLHRVRWVLVVEKEATFRTCVSTLSTYNDGHGGLLITAKGYPDLITRDFVSLLAGQNACAMFAPLPIYTLVDFDPDGYGIHVCYAQTAPVRLLGLRSDQLEACVFNESSVATPLIMSMRDRTRARNMLRRDAELLGHNMCADLQKMMVLNMKMELQHLDDADDGLQRLLQTGIKEWTPG